MYVFMFAFIAVAVEVKSGDTNKHGVTRRDLVNKQLKAMKYIDANNATMHY